MPAILLLIPEHTKNKRKRKKTNKIVTVSHDINVSFNKLQIQHKNNISNKKSVEKMKTTPQQQNSIIYEISQFIKKRKNLKIKITSHTLHHVRCEISKVW